MEEKNTKKFLKAKFNQFLRINTFSPHYHHRPSTGGGSTLLHLPLHPYPPTVGGIDLHLRSHRVEGGSIPLDLALVDNISSPRGEEERFAQYFMFAPSAGGVSLERSPLEGRSSLSLSKLYRGASWLEREQYDMFGVLFIGNGDLRRILTDYGFRGFPLRKDFPPVGYFDLAYCEESGQLAVAPLSLSQEMRVAHIRTRVENVQ